jgi:DNA-binding NtrC family response regulator
MIRNASEVRSLEDFAEQLVAPLRVLVVDTEEGSFAKIEAALSTYHVDIYNASCGCEAVVCLQKLAPFNLAFVGVPLKTFGTPLDVIREIRRVSPGASVVIMARNMQDEQVVKIMGLDVFTFLKKNGDFNREHIQKIASQLNLPLRPK